MMRRSVVAGVVAWVSVVTVASGVTWAVIDRAGQEALSDKAIATAVPDLAETVSPTVQTPSVSADAVRPSAPEGAGSEWLATDRTWRGAPGTVVAQCAGSKADLRSATPNDDFFVEVESDGQDEVEVKFESASGHEVKVRVDCVGGAPRFKVESDAGEGG